MHGRTARHHRHLILTDGTASGNNPNPLNAGGWRRLAGRLKNTNLLFGDGQVETRKAA